MTDKNHIHQLRRKRYKTGQPFFYCIGEDCTFKINADLALNKRTLCNRCGQPFLLTPYSMKLAKPHCENCHKSKSTTSSGNNFLDNFTPGGFTRHEEMTTDGTNLQERLSAVVSPEVQVNPAEDSSTSERPSATGINSPVLYRTLEDDDEDDIL
jgi:late competence protein required for DNA uptake (superfamily II DNA/RNA helicase)